MVNNMENKLIEQTEKLSKEELEIFYKHLRYIVYFKTQTHII